MGLSASRPAWQLPVQWPDAARNSDAGSAVRDRLLKAAILLAMLALTVLDRFGFFEKAAAGMLAMYALAGAMVLGRAAAPNFRAALAYLAMVSAATLSLSVNAASGSLSLVSIGSFLFLIVLYAPLCVSLRQGAVAPELWRWTVNVYIAFTVFVAVAGIVQFFAQFVFRPAWLFDYTPLIPEIVRAPGSTWNTDYTVGADGVPSDERSLSAWTKSNGFFMREPSFFSVVMAFGLVCELSMRRRVWVMSVLVLGLVLSYSGTGLLCLAAALLFPLGRGTLVRVLAFAVLAAAIFVLFGDALNLSYTLGRADEFLSTRSSGYCRFVAPAIAVVQHMESQPWTSLLGNGPGSMVRMLTTDGCTGKPAFAKALFEYGLVGTLAFGVLMIGALNRSSAPVRVRVATGVAWLLFGNLLESLFLLFLYVVSAMWPEDAARTALKSGARGRPAQRGVPRR